MASAEARHAASGQATPIVLEPDRPMGLAAFAEITALNRPLAVADGLADRLDQGAALLDGWIGERRRIYGVTTGYGPLATSHLGPERSAELQRNLVHHLASGVGNPLPPLHSRAVMTARVAALCRGCSAVPAALVRHLVTALNRGFTPVVPEKGTVGASGDLTPLAHVVLALLGEGEAWQDGTIRPSAEVMRRHGLEPLRLGPKEGIALVNGTSAMTGIAALNGVLARGLLDLVVPMSVLFAELLHGRREAWHPALGEARPHPGQIWAHHALWAASEGSARLTPFTPVPPPLASALAAGAVLQGQRCHQDPYTIRCAPQLLGAVHDVVAQHNRTVAIELDSATDNPLLFLDPPMLVHGGNFLGQPVAFASDALDHALIGLAGLIERRVARLTDPALNGGLPAFLQPNETGLRSGFMGAQVTATALLAELRVHATPASIQSIPTNGNNQDIVSMGTIGARRAAAALDDLFALVAIEALALAQAFDLERGADDDRGFCAGSRAFAGWVRRHAAFLDEDRTLAPDIARLATLLRDEALTRGIAALRAEERAAA